VYYCADGAYPTGGLIADAEGNLFGTTSFSGAFGPCSATFFECPTVFEIVKTASGYAFTTLVSFNGTGGPCSSLTADATGILFGTFGTAGGTLSEIVKTASGYASSPTTLVSFNGSSPCGSLIADANGNLFGMTSMGGAYGYGTVFEIVKTASGYANTPTVLINFNGVNGNVVNPSGLIVDAVGNLFGTTYGGGSSNCLTGGEELGCGTVFEIVKTASGYASTPTTLYSFCSQASCTDGAFPVGSLIADANGNLLGTTGGGGAYGYGTVLEITGSGFVPPEVLAGTPGSANCIGKTVSGLAREYSTFLDAAITLGYSSQGLQNEVMMYCGG
jgi:uncharacterized repeat protein (TIGR03803 family)